MQNDVSGNVLCSLQFCIVTFAVADINRIVVFARAKEAVTFSQTLPTDVSRMQCFVVPAV